MVWRFARLRLVICVLLSVLYTVLQFLGPSVLVRLILEYLEDPSLEVSTGIVLLVLLFCNQILKNVTFSLAKCLGCHTGKSVRPSKSENYNLISAALRLLGGLQYAGYSKLLRLASPSEAALGQLITFVTADQERIERAIYDGSMILTTPVMILISLVYGVYIAGFSAVVGFLALMILFPIMVNINSGV